MCISFGNPNICTQILGRADVGIGPYDASREILRFTCMYYVS